MTKVKQAAKGMCMKKQDNLRNITYTGQGHSKQKLLFLVTN